MKPFSTNVPFMDKPDSWFLLPKCHSLPQVFLKHFASKNQLPGFCISGTLVKNGLRKPRNLKTCLLFCAEDYIWIIVKRFPIKKKVIALLNIS